MVLVIGLLAGGAIILPGCSRKYYRTSADQDVAAIYAEKRCEEAYTLPPLDGIDVDPRSRFFDPSPEDCPALPSPVPTLFGYQLPALTTGDPTRQDSVPEVDVVTPETERLTPPLEGEPAAQELPKPSDELPAPKSDLEALLEETPGLEAPLTESTVKSPEVSLVSMDQSASSTSDQVSNGESVERVADPGEVRLAEMIREASEEDVDVPLDDPDVIEGADGLRIVPVPQDYWGQLPESCVSRMLEFQSVQTEFRRSFPDPERHPVADQLSDAPRLTLPMITELASINNRDIQTVKERLFRAALNLSAQRYEYVLRPTRGGTGTGAFYSHIRRDSTTVNGLTIPTEAGVGKTTAMAGQFLASFANRVILTFNGPQGFAADIGTDLIFDFQQTLFQRDVVFESLTRAERRVIYAARDLVRAKRALFVDLATDYYQLLLIYRGIEISSQDYFSNLRAFLQGRAEYLQAGRIPRVQVDQFEQNALGSRSSLVSACNALETSLDRLKLVIGLPPEMPLNLNLTELETLTTSDELTVTRQLVMRTRQILVDASKSKLRDRNAAVNGATVLINRLLHSLTVRRKLSDDPMLDVVEQDAQQWRRSLALLEKRLQCDDLRKARDGELRADVPPTKGRQFARTMDLVDALLQQARAAVEIHEAAPPEEKPEGLKGAMESIISFENHLEILYDDWVRAVREEQLDQLPILVDNANALLADADRLAGRLAGDLLPEETDELDSLIIETVTTAVQLADEVESSKVSGLDSVDVEEDQAMMLALYQRLDLMNTRSELADLRRQIKLSADDLRAIVDIRATQVLAADRTTNNLFSASADGSTTRLSIALDTPLNRRIERNNYRASLIDYQAGRRALIGEQDSIKFQIREDLRQLRLRRNQYEISVARAALAYERVVSTRLQLQLAVGNVVARDFLEAQTAFTSALNSVARDHLSFIRGRIDLFYDTESIRLDQNGYWTAVLEDTLELPFVPDFSDANPNPYGRLPACLKYSDEVRQNH